MHPSRADHKVWNKLPFRENKERIAKYGQGFSYRLNILSSKPDDTITILPSVAIKQKSAYIKTRLNKSIDQMVPVLKSSVLNSP